MRRGRNRVVVVLDSSVLGPLGGHGRSAYQPPTGLRRLISRGEPDQLRHCKRPRRLHQLTSCGIDLGHRQRHAGQRHGRVASVDRLRLPDVEIDRMRQGATPAPIAGVV